MIWEKHLIILSDWHPSPFTPVILTEMVQCNEESFQQKVYGNLSVLISASYTEITVSLGMTERAI